MAQIKRLDNKKYSIKVSKTNDGKRIRKHKTFYGTKKEAEAEAIKMESELISQIGIVDTRRITFSQFAQIWFRDYGNDHLKAKTLRTYKDLINKCIKVYWLTSN